MLWSENKSYQCEIVLLNASSKVDDDLSLASGVFDIFVFFI